MRDGLKTVAEIHEACEQDLALRQDGPVRETLTAALGGSRSGNLDDLTLANVDLTLSRIARQRQALDWLSDRLA
jgi:hypothetical protein